MNDILFNIHEYFYALPWVVAAVALLLSYVFINEVVKLFSSVDEEMWEKE
ncbi:MAG: hypothetical protein JRF40_10795 [Deltaproteobacteria bacterium]|nr:hypothetical protein [Deltaproteobacteria bacterium]